MAKREYFVQTWPDGKAFSIKKPLKYYTTTDYDCRGKSTG